ncbi:zinc-binding dehydrogenase, partial [Klebsiella pneumoniae]|uniref:zinc-binding dehydrogenase n=1 Tax=Klebsiella pneumoniae TaxID=573 RepID=UPI001904EB60
YKSIAQQSKFLPGQDVVVFGTRPLGLFSVQMARIMAAVNIVNVGLEEDVAVRFPIAKELGATAVVNGSTEDVVTRCQEICGKDNLGLVIECSGANIALKQSIEMLRP